MYVLLWSVFVMVIIIFVYKRVTEYDRSTVVQSSSFRYTFSTLGSLVVPFRRSFQSTFSYCFRPKLETMIVEQSDVTM